MKNYLNSLNERERWMLLIGGACLILYLYYLVAYAPLTNRLEEQNKILIEKIETLQWMKQIEQQAHSTSNKKKVDNSELLTLIANQLKENQKLKYPYQLQQISSGEIQLNFETVPFNFFLRWLENLSKEYAVRIKQWDVDPSQTPGLTRVALIIARV